AAESLVAQFCKRALVPATKCSDQLQTESRLRFDLSGRACIGPSVRVSTLCNECPCQPPNGPPATFHRPAGHSCCRGFDRSPSLCRDVRNRAPSLRRTQCNQPAGGKAVTPQVPGQSKSACDGPALLHDTQCLRC